MVGSRNVYIILNSLKHDRLSPMNEKKRILKCENATKMLNDKKMHKILAKFREMYL